MRYEKYKDSGFDWIGEIPEHWEVKKIKYVIKKLETGKREINPKSNDILSIGGEHINFNGKIEIRNSRYVSQEFYNNFKNGKINKNDILMVKDGATIGKTALVDFDPQNKMLLNEHVYKIVADKYYYYYFLSHYFQSNIWKENQSSAQEGITRTTILNSFSFFIPSFKEQTAIANYLDRKTAEIDELINKKEQLLKLYEEEKTAIINQAVTKGINPDVKMKDSGIDWLGEIPEHWEVKKLKYVVDINKETLSDKTDGDYQIEYIDIGNVEYGKLKERPKKLLFEKAPSRARRVVNSGDTLISTVRTYLKAILFIENANDNLIASTGFAVIAPSDDFLPDYLFYILSSEIVLQNITASSVGVSYPAINASEIGGFYSWFPEKQEQKTIIDFIVIEMNKINTKVEKTKKLIDLLGEYKQSLISEVVTGKIKVV
jgi:type I restriction enzyme S subunit